MKRLFSRFLMAAIAAIFICGGTARATTLTGTLNNPDGSPFNGTIFLTLSQAGTISSTGTCGGPIYVPNTFQVSIQVVAGAIVSSPSIYDSMCFATPGIPYSVQLVSSTGAVVAQTWVITSSPLQTGSENVGTIIPISISGVVFQLPAAANVTSFLFGSTSVPLSSTVPSGSTNYLCNVSGQIVGCSGGAGGMTWPSGGAGIPNYTGGSAYSTTYNASNLIPANFLPKATGSTFGIIEPDGSSCTVTSGVLSCSGSGALPINNPTFTGAMNGPTMTVGSTVQLAPLNAVGNGTTDDTTALQTAITNNRYLVLAKGANYLISAALTIPCGVATTIDFNHSTLTLKNASNSYMLKVNCTLGDGTHLVLVHGILNGNGSNQTPNYTSPLWTGYFGMAAEFYHVDYVDMRDWRVLNSSTWGVGITLCGETVFKDFYFDTNQNIDDIGGIQGSATNIYIDHVWGYQPDDVIGITTGTGSLNGHDIGVTTGNNIDIQNLVIKNLNMVPNDANTQYSFGIGIYPTAGHTIHNLDIENIAGVYADHVLRIYDYWPAAGVPDYMDNIHLANIQGTVGTPSAITAALRVADVDIPFRTVADASTGAPFPRPGLTYAPSMLAATIPLYSSKFVGTPSSALSGFLPETGGGWTTVNGSWALSSGGTYLQQNTTITSGILRGGAITTIPDDQTSQDNYTISSLMFAGNLTYPPGIIFRYQDANNFWIAEMESTQLAVYEASAGVLTLISATPGTLPVSSVYTLSVIAVGSSIVAQEVNANGMISTPLITSTDFEAATSIGVKSPDPSARIYNLQATYSYGVESGFSAVNNALLNASNVFTGVNSFPLILGSQAVTIAAGVGAGTGGTAVCYSGAHCTLSGGMVQVGVGTSPAVGKQFTVTTTGAALPNALNCTVVGAGTTGVTNPSLLGVSAYGQTTAAFSGAVNTAPTASGTYYYAYNCSD